MLASPIQEGKNRNQDSSQWISSLAEFQQPSVGKATWQIVNTLVPYIALWGLMAFMHARGVSFWWTLLPIIVAAGLTVRIFILFHDCTHDCFFPSKQANRILGYITGILTFTPFDEWKKKHAMHHAGSGNLDKRGVGDVWTMTVDEFRAAPLKTQLGYRLYRNPFILLVLGAPYLFLIQHRFSTTVTGDAGRRSVNITNLAIVVMVAAGVLLFGWKAYVLIQLPIILLASMAGVWLFYVQHQYERPYWAPTEEWDPVAAAMEGSSYYKLPQPLQWFSGNIGLHHIHHLRARIPNYNLQACYNKIPRLQQIEPLTLFGSFRCLFLNLWDDEKQTMVSFRAAKQAS